MNRRELLGAGAAFAGAAAVAGPLEAFAARAMSGRATATRGYGALRERGDLALPNGFQYRILSREGDPMRDGNPTPTSFDGMASFARSDGRIVLVRNHENKSLPGDIPVVVPASRRYDADSLPSFNGGCTKVVVGPGRRVTESFAVLGGTIFNCAGGTTPWGSWITCEELFTDGEEPHGYAFEVPAEAGGPVEPVPIVAAGRFVHEAVAWYDGVLYLTEDRRDDACFYRFLPARPPRQAGDLARAGGTLQALRIRDRPRADTDAGWPVGQSFPVDWVTLPELNASTDTVRVEARELGAAVFDREEGIWVGNGKVYFDCTEGGDANAGQIWEYDPVPETLRLVYESPGPEQLQGPDNLVVAPTGDLFICEDSAPPQFIRGLTPEGQIYDFARSVTNDSEFCGACFSPSGRTLFVNQQGALGAGEDVAVTYAIWGPFARAGRPGAKPPVKHPHAPDG